MKIVIYKALVEQIAEFDGCWSAFQDALRAMEEITHSAKNRMAANKSYTADRILELKKQLADQSRTATLHAMARRELEKLEAAQDATTVAEVEAFDQAAKEARQALDDWGRVRGELMEMFDGAKINLANARAATIGDHARDPMLARNWIDSATKEFAKIKN